MSLGTATETTVAQGSRKSNPPRVDRDEIIKLLRCFRVFPKAHVDAGTQQGGLDEARILPERFVAILNGQFVFAFPGKNLRTNVERWPQFGIGVEGRRSEEHTSELQSPMYLV